MSDRALRREGSVLLLALVVLFVLGALIGGFQYVSLHANRHARMAVEGQSDLLRADGLVQMLVSRHKRTMFPGYQDLTDAPASGSETGRWDGRPFALGWYRERRPTADPSFDLAVWTRSGEDGARTFRHDLELSIATSLRPRVVRVVRVTAEDIDPADAAARAAAFRKFDRSRNVAAARDALAEAATDIAEEVGPARSGAATRAALIPLAARAAPLSALIAQVSAVAETDDLPARVDEARKLAALAAPCARRWKDLASWQLAIALAAQADRAERPRRIAMLGEARGLLEAMLRPAGACCSEPLVAWKLACVIARQRSDLTDRGQLASARGEGETVLRDLALRRRGFVHERADIEVQELPAYFASVWKARVAAGVLTQNGMYAVVSALEDGSEALAHLESAQWLGPLGFRGDGGSLFAGALAWTPATRRMSLWEVSLDGLALTSLSSRPISAAPPRDWMVSSLIQASPDGSAVLIAGATVDPAAPVGPTGGPLAGLLGPGVARTNMFAEGERRVELPPDGWRTLNGTSVAWSPDGGEVAMLRSGPAGDSTLMLLPRDGLPSVRASVPLPGWESNLMSNVTWMRWSGAEWVAAANTGGGSGPPSVTVRFVDPVDPSRTVDRTIAPVDHGGDDTRWIETLLVRDPPACLVAAGTRLHLVAVPPAAPSAVELPRALAGRIERVGMVRVPPWGGVAFFLARPRGSPEGKGEAFSVYGVRLRTGDHRALFGPGSQFPLTQRITQLAVSPLPEAP